MGNSYSYMPPYAAPVYVQSKPSYTPSYRPTYQPTYTPPKQPVYYNNTTVKPQYYNTNNYDYTTNNYDYRSYPVTNNNFYRQDTNNYYRNDFYNNQHTSNTRIEDNDTTSVNVDYSVFAPKTTTISNSGNVTFNNQISAPRTVSLPPVVTQKAGLPWWPLLLVVPFLFCGKTPEAPPAPPGPKGPQGPQGPEGPPGKTVTVPSETPHDEVSGLFGDPYVMDSDNSNLKANLGKLLGEHFTNADEKALIPMISGQHHDAGTYRLYDEAGGMVANGYFKDVTKTGGPKETALREAKVQTSAGSVVDIKSLFNKTAKKHDHLEVVVNGTTYTKPPSSGNVITQADGSTVTLLVNAAGNIWGVDVKKDDTTLSYRAEGSRFVAQRSGVVKNTYASANFGGTLGKGFDDNAIDEHAVTMTNKGLDDFTTP